MYEEIERVPIDMTSRLPARRLTMLNDGAMSRAVAARTAELQAEVDQLRRERDDLRGQLRAACSRTRMLEGHLTRTARANARRTMARLDRDRAAQGDRVSGWWWFLCGCDVALILMMIIDTF